MPRVRRDAGGAESEPADPHDGVLDLQEEVLHAVRAAARQELGRCPYCAQIAQQAAAAPAKLQELKTQAFVIDSSGGPGSMQLLGWLVPLQGPQTRRAVHAAAEDGDRHRRRSVRSCCNDKFMSSKHAEIKAENGMWVLRDTGSTNGTYVNNRRVDRHELVDNDFIKFGSAMLKFKSL